MAAFADYKSGASGAKKDSPPEASASPQAEKPAPGAKAHGAMRTIAGLWERHTSAHLQICNIPQAAPCDGCLVRRGELVAGNEGEQQDGRGC